MNLSGLPTSRPLGTWSHLVRVTFTGVDEATDLGAVAALAQAHPGLEFGFLWSPKRSGQDPRYPRWAFLEQAAEQLAGSGASLALHLCGQGAADWIAGHEPTHALARRFNRIQVNGHARRMDVDALVAQIERGAHPAVITQHHAANAALTARLTGQPNHAVLFDESGGHGVARTSWPAPVDGIPCGYAGGLGPNRMDDALQAIDAACTRPYWVDMEGALRDGQDRFDLAAVAAVIREVFATADERSKAALDELARLGQEMGDYDL